MEFTQLHLFFNSNSIIHEMNCWLRRKKKRLRVEEWNGAPKEKFKEFLCLLPLRLHSFIGFHWFHSISINFFHKWREAKDIPLNQRQKVVFAFIPFPFIFHLFHWFINSSIQQIITFIKKINLFNQIKVLIFLASNNSSSSFWVGPRRRAECWLACGAAAASSKSMKLICFGWPSGPYFPFHPSN